MPAASTFLPRDPRPEDDAEWTDARSPVSEPESDRAEPTVTATCDIDRATGEGASGLLALSAMSAARSDGKPLSVPADSSSRFDTGDAAPTLKATPSRRIPLRLRNVYVGALPLSFTDADLTALLSEFGKVKSCRMFNTGARVAEIGRAYGFALFEDSTSAERAVAALDGKPLGNARIQCQLSRNGVVKKPKGAPKPQAWQPTPPRPDPLLESASASLQAFPSAVYVPSPSSLAHSAGSDPMRLDPSSNHSTSSMFAPPHSLHSTPQIPPFSMSFTHFQALAVSFPSGMPGQPPAAASSCLNVAPPAVPVATPTGIVWMRPV